jgi:hypothetical protein
MVAIHFTPASIGSRSVKKGRHRRFEEARKLKQSGPDFLFSNDSGRDDTSSSDAEPEEEDDYAALARKYGAFDDDDTASVVDDADAG